LFVFFNKALFPLPVDTIDMSSVLLLVPAYAPIVAPIDDPLSRPLEGDGGLLEISFVDADLSRFPDGGAKVTIGAD
jgi:hypothetical protein